MLQCKCDLTSPCELLPEKSLSGTKRKRHEESRACCADCWGWQRQGQTKFERLPPLGKGPPGIRVPPTGSRENCPGQSTPASCFPRTERAGVNSSLQPCLPAASWRGSLAEQGRPAGLRSAVRKVSSDTPQTGPPEHSLDSTAPDCTRPLH